MIIHLPGMPLPTESNLDITIRVTQPLNITAFSGGPRVAQYVMNELSTQFGADAPELTVGERVYWSVPVVFTLPGKGVLGRVGTPRVDAGTGVLLTDPQAEREMRDHAGQLAQRTSLSAGARVFVRRGLRSDGPGPLRRPPREATRGIAGQACYPNRVPIGAYIHCPRAPRAPLNASRCLE